MKTKLFIIVLLVLSFTNIKAQNVISGTECTSAVIKEIMTKAGIEVILAQPDYIQIVQDAKLQIKTFIDISTENQWLVFNLANELKAGITSAQAKELVLSINAQTNLIRATYDEDKNKVEFRYYFVTKGGFTKDALLYALDMFKTTYLYAIVTVDSKELFK
jgi:hypothetical protein